MKKLFAMGLSVVLAASMLVGCGGSGDEGKKGKDEAKAKGVKVIDVDLQQIFWRWRAHACDFR